MTNHPNRARKHKYGYVVVKGDTMTNGYIDSQGGKSLAIQMVDGVAYQYDVLVDRPMIWEAPLIVDAAGEITRQGAVPGYGFSPDAGELDRIAALGYVIPQI